MSKTIPYILHYKSYAGAGGSRLFRRSQMRIPLSGMRVLAHIKTPQGVDIQVMHPTWFHTRYFTLTRVAKF